MIVACNLSTNIIFTIVLKDGQTPVILAIKLRNKDLVTVLIENGADINTPSGEVRTYEAFYYDNNVCLIRLLKILSLYICH